MRHRVLIADDEEDARTGLATLVSTWGYEVAEAVAVARELELPDVQRQGFQKTFEELISLPNIRHMAKVSILRSAAERLVHTTRILTDVRPIFDDDADDGPAGAVIMHQLEMSVWTEGRHLEMYFALDEDDLVKLQSDVRRALDKGKTLQGFLDRAGLPVHASSEEA